MDHTHRRLIFLFAFLLFGILLAVVLSWTFVSSVNLSAKKTPILQASVLPKPTQQTSLPAQPRGTLTGNVTIGPNCPVERIGHPCTPSPQAYTRYVLLLYTQDKSTVVKTIVPDQRGEFTVGIDPGTYILDSANQGIGFHSKNLPQTIVIMPNQIESVSIAFDTGIR